MSIETKNHPESALVSEQPSQDAVDGLAGLLPADELADALKGLDPEQITGPGGLLTQLAGRVIETALESELTDHLGYPPGQAPPGGAGTTATAQPRRRSRPARRGQDQQPARPGRHVRAQLVGKHQRRLAGLDEKIIGLYAGGMSVRDIESHLQDLYGVQIGRDTISRVTDAILEDVQAWRTRPLERVYPIAYFDCLMVKVREDHSVRNRACYLAIGVSVEGEREVLGIWWQETEGANFWLAVLNNLHHRGVEDILVCCVDGLTGFPEAIEAGLPPGLGADLHRALCRPPGLCRLGVLGWLVVGGSGVVWSA